MIINFSGIIVHLRKKSNDWKPFCTSIFTNWARSHLTTQLGIRENCLIPEKSESVIYRSCIYQSTIIDTGYETKITFKSRLPLNEEFPTNSYA